MNYFLGIDGGGSKSTGIVTDHNLRMVYTASGGPTNFLASDLNTAAQNIMSLIDIFKKKLVIGYNDIASVCIGTAGAGRREDAVLIKEKLEELIKLDGGKVKNLSIVSDVEIALEGAFAGQPGIILISGTGSICCAKNKIGQIIRVGGNGRILGDEGSGYAIGRKGLRTALRSYDGRCLETKLLNRIFQFMQVETPADVIRKVYKENFNIASLAEIIIKCGTEGDEASWNILNEEAEELVLHLYAILPKLDESNVKITLSGSLLTNDTLFKDLVVKRIIKSFPGLEIVQPEYSPELGAAMLAKAFYSK